MSLYYCPTCTRVYYLPDDTPYICGRNHAVSVWADGKARRFVISNKTETNRPPWPVPEVSEEREIFTQDYMETGLDACPHPEDEDYSDIGRHFGYGAPGGRHLSRDEVLEKYSQFVLKPVEGNASS